MAREILFKAKRIDNGEWVEGYYVKAEIYPSSIFTDIDSSYGELYEEYSIDENTLCQYTGLTDKNGNKIWENDVVRHEDLSSGRYIFREQPMKNSCIRFDTTEARFERSDKLSLYRTHETLEVIGNIFDNPELLGGGE